MTYSRFTGSIEVLAQIEPGSTLSSSETLTPTISSSSIFASSENSATVHWPRMRLYSKKLREDANCVCKQQEIKLVMQHGVHPDRIIFAHPAKYPSHITYARKVDVKQMTVDDEYELFKIKDLFPEAK